MDETVQSWLERSTYDLDTAKAMLESGRHLYVLFCCQQAIEKSLKAVMVQKTGDLPPRIHNLLRLAERAGIELDEDRRDLLGRLSAYYIQSRYPEEIKELGARIDRKMASDILAQTEENIRWLRSTIN